MSNEKKRLPPYIAYQTFKTFVSHLREQPQLPARIDQSYWSRWLSGSSGVQMVAALRFLSLVDEYGKPNNLLRLLTQAKDDQQTVILAEIAKKSYTFVFENPNYKKDINNATHDQLVGCFEGNFQLKPDVSRKCIKFFVSMATDAKIPLSPFVTKKFRNESAKTKVPEQKSSTKRVPVKVNRNLEVPEPAKVPELHISSWHSKLLDKFPQLDPAWSEEIKNQWFSAFDKLLERGPWNVPRK